MRSIKGFSRSNPIAAMLWIPPGDTLRWESHALISSAHAFALSLVTLCNAVLSTGRQSFTCLSARLFLLWWLRFHACEFPLVYRQENWTRWCLQHRRTHAIEELYGADVGNANLFTYIYLFHLRSCLGHNLKGASCKSRHPWHMCGAWLNVQETARAHIAADNFSAKLGESAFLIDLCMWPTDYIKAILYHENYPYNPGCTRVTNT